SPQQRAQALLEAFRTVKDFADVEKFYGGKRIPEDEFFLNTLTRDFNISRDRVQQFAQVFLKNLAFLRAFSAAPDMPEAGQPQADAAQQTTPPQRIPSPVISKEPRGREFLDT